MPTKKESLKESMDRLEEIVKWFEADRDLDLDAGLDKVREGAALIKQLKARLNEAENEFKEIQKDLEA